MPAEYFGHQNQGIFAKQMKSIALTGYPKEYTDSDTAVYSFDEYLEKSGDFDAILRVAQELLDL
jgi:hypothetical protein